ncbi:MAG: Multidrug export protein AcrF [Marinobacterium sp. xm-d-530]|nr:MAG: Multidrug export protein AcrF [Marinobacterium sp. xm-d-530]
MILSEVSVRRPIFATVISLLLVVFGVLAWQNLSLREYPDVSRPQINISTSYIGAAPEVVELKITSPIEDRLSGIEGVRFIESTSARNTSRISITFETSRSLDDAANDVREAVSRAARSLPNDASPPVVSKSGARGDIILYIIVSSNNMNGVELTDYAQRTLKERLERVNGVSTVNLLGAREYVLRVELDPDRLNALNLSPQEVVNSLKRENLELRGGELSGKQRTLQIQIPRTYNEIADFKDLVVKQAPGALIRLSDVATVTTGPKNTDEMFRADSQEVVALGIEPISTANPLTVVDRVKKELELFRPFLPEGTELRTSYDVSVFITSAISEVYTTLAIAALLVIIVIWVFLGDVRATLIPAITVPISLIAACTAIYLFDFSLNLLTLLAMVLAVGLVVDDTIVVVENIHRHLDRGKPALLAAWDGIREVGFAVVATTLVLVATFVPIVFLPGTVGQFFREYALTLTAAVIFSSVVALTLAPVLSAKLLHRHNKSNPKAGLSRLMRPIERLYQTLIKKSLRFRWLALLIIGLSFIGIYVASEQIPRTLMPTEDRGSIFVIVQGQEGASALSMQEAMLAVERKLDPWLKESGVESTLLRTPGWGTRGDNSGFMIIGLKPWDQRNKHASELVGEMRKLFNGIPDVNVRPILRSAIRAGSRTPVQFVIGGGEFEEMERWSELLINRAEENPGLVDLDIDFRRNQPQIRADFDRERAASLGISAESLGATMELMLGGTVATQFMERGRQYDVWVQGARHLLSDTEQLTRLSVRSSTTGELIPLDNLVTFKTVGEAPRLPHYNRTRAITLEAGLAEGYTLGEAIDYLDKIASELLPPEAVIDYQGESLDYKTDSQSIEWIFLFALIVVFLVLAAQFESFINPMIVMFTVPLGILGGLLGLIYTNEALTIYSQLALIMLIGLGAKNSILIVEFANQLRDKGVSFEEAIVEASTRRLRPILMTALTTILGALPLIMASGAGAESRSSIGVVVFAGVSLATLLTLIVTPLSYNLFARKTGSPERVSKELEAQIENHQ